MWPVFARVDERSVRVWLGPGTDTTVFREMFVDRTYDVLPRIAPSTIIDIGANVGCSTIWFAMKYPTARIWAYEPDPSNFGRLRKNTEWCPNITLCREAVSDTSAGATLYTARGRGLSSSTKFRAGLVPQRVPSVTLDKAIERAGGSADIVKFDIEGAEYEAFKNVSKLSNVAWYIGEVHPDLLSVAPSAVESLFSGYSIRRRPLANKRYLLTAGPSFL